MNPSARTSDLTRGIAALAAEAAARGMCALVSPPSVFAASFRMPPTLDATFAALAASPAREVLAAIAGAPGAGSLAPSFASSHLLRTLSAAAAPLLQTFSEPVAPSLPKLFQIADRRSRPAGGALGVKPINDNGDEHA